MSKIRLSGRQRLPYLLVLVAIAAVAVFGGLASQPAREAEATSPGFGNNLGVVYGTFAAGSGRIAVDLNTSAPHNGLLTTFSYRREAAGVGRSFRFLLFENVAGVLTVRYVGPLITVPVGPDGPVDVPVLGGVPVQAGWYLGVYSPGLQAVPHRAVGGALLRFTVTGMATPAVGQTPFVLFEAGTSPIAAEAAIAATYGCGLTCYVDAITGDDANNHGTSPTDAFKTIGKGVDAVQPGGTVIVAAGTYSEGVGIGKPLTLRGPNVGRAGYAPRLAEAVVDSGSDLITFFVFATNGVVIDGFKIHASTSCVLAQGSLNVTVRNSILEDCGDVSVSFDGPGPPFGVNGGLISRNLFLDPDVHHVAVTGSSNVTISDNEMTGGTGLEAMLILQSSNISILRNFIHDNPCSHFLCQGQVGLQDVVGGLIAENDIRGDESDTPDGGVPLFFYGGNSSIVVRNNILAADGTKPSVDVSFVFSGPNSGLSFAFNDLSMNVGEGLRVEAGSHTGTLLAERNWWGHVSGPNLNGGGPGTGSEIFAGAGITVDFDPWLCKGDDLAPAVIGFQPRWLSIYDGSPCDTTKPEWVVSYKTSSFPSLPYVPGTPGPWSTKPVIITFTCQDTGSPQSPIQIASGVKQISLRDGVWTNANIPWTEGPLKGDVLAEYCMDMAGNIADPVPAIPAGQSIRVDTKAPVCQPTVTSYYIPKNTAGYVLNIPVKGTETGSGIDFGASSIVTSGLPITSKTFTGAPPNLVAQVTLNTPNVSFASLSVTVTLVDNAGNVGKCPTLTFYTSW